MDPDRRSALRARLLRGLVIVLSAVALVAAVSGFVRSVEVYDDSRGCVGDAIARLFLIEHGARGPCEPHWVLTTTRTPTTRPDVMLLYFAIIMLPGITVWRR